MKDSGPVRRRTPLDLRRASENRRKIKQLNLEAEVREGRVR